MSRIARNRPVVFVEEPILMGNPDYRPFLGIRREGENLTVIQPHALPQEELPPTISAQNQAIVNEMLAWMLPRLGFENVVRWHYTPLTLHLRDAVPYHTTVYDCMDELSAFKNAPPEIVENERTLLGEADLVFTGGRSMYLNKRQHNPNTHRFDSGVDVEHFQQATLAATPVPDDIAPISGPILGYYGVIDERMDWEALTALADTDPTWQVVMIGPVVKIDPADLPQRPNIHYLGARLYPDLPRYLKAFDVAMIPFADNDATRYLSPTKTLEYFAGHKPVVSSPVEDVVVNYGEIVRIARSPQEWVQAVRETLNSDDPARLQAGLQQAQEKTWDAIAAEMERLIDEAAAAKR